MDVIILSHLATMNKASAYFAFSKVRLDALFVVVQPDRINLYGRTIYYDSFNSGDGWWKGIALNGKREGLWFGDIWIKELYEYQRFEKGVRVGPSFEYDHSGNLVQMVLNDKIIFSIL